jgi:PleD family two-component response regulator
LLVYKNTSKSDRTDAANRLIVQIPLTPTSSKASQDERSLESSLDLNGIKVVDDETDTRQLMAFLLEQQGARVTAATSAHEALLIWAQAKPDVLLGDSDYSTVPRLLLPRKLGD